MKVLVIHVSAGAGHQKAAEAIYDGIRKSSPHEAVLADALDHTSVFFKRFYRQTYRFLISRMPWLWGFFFRILDVPRLEPLTGPARRLYNMVNARRLGKFLEQEAFDCIVSTHFMPSEVACALKRSGRIRSRLITVITDFDVHRFWLGAEVDVYAVASGWTKQELNRLGVEEARIVVSGIPTHEKFFLPQNRGQLKKQMGLQEDIFTVLMATGSFGIGPIEEIIHALRGVQIIVVCGYNQNLFRRLSGKKDDFVRVMGLVDNMHELMAVSDVMLTKPGGLSIAEALVSQLPLIFFNPIPGQEAHNVRVLKEHGIGASPADISGIIEEIKKLQSSRDFYLTTLKKTREMARPFAVRDIVALIS
jgi:processive 1,2-diacylglycerol beta-glucosyltransferase